MNPFPVKITLKGAKLSDAVWELKHYSRSDDIKEVPSDVAAFLSALNWNANKEPDQNFFADWPGNAWAEDMLNRWDWDGDIRRKANEAYEPIKGEINLAAKYFYSWKIIQSILALKPKLCNELVWESGDDLDASFLLAKNGYFKQAFQLLRNYLEVSVAILYFIIDAEAKKGWTKAVILFLNSIIKRKIGNEGIC